jgi:hexosaminidase
MTESGPAFEAAIEGGAIRCRLASAVLLPAPVWCFSLPRPARVRSGGTLVHSVGGWHEVQLPDLVPGEPRELVLEGAEPALNRAWLPRGGYLRCEDDRLLRLPDPPAGPPPRPARPAPAWDGLPLLPQPELWAPAGGTLAVPAFADPGCEALAEVAALSRRLGLGPFLAPGGVALSVEAAPLPAGAYVLGIGPGGVTLRAGDRAGRLHGGASLVQLLALTAGALPCGVIEDAPRFAWRGLLLDAARHAFGADWTLRLLDLMALLKLNRLHWRLADDEAFRLDLASAPDLAARTALRGEGLLLPGLHGAGPRAGRPIGRDEARALVARAGRLGIGVMPGLSLPTRAYALLAARPALRDPEDPGAIASAEGYAGNLLNPGLAASWDLLGLLLAETAGLFPLGLVHLGGEAVPEGAWAASPAARRLMAAEGLGAEAELQGWTAARMAALLAAAGAGAAGWESSGLPAPAPLWCRTRDAAVAHARAGREVVVTPFRRIGLESPYSEAADDWGGPRPGAVALETTVAWRVVPEGADDIEDQVVGVEGTLWSEAIGRDEEAEPMLAPRLLGLACKAWEAEGTTDGVSLRALAALWAPLFDRIGWRRHGGA